MSASAKPTNTAVIPTLRYRDVNGAIDWLCAAFGFTPHSVMHGSDGEISAAQLVAGRSMIILVPVGDSPLDTHMRQPDEIDGAETQNCYFVVENCQAHYTQATARGAEIVLELQRLEKGGAGYMARDPEGHLWSFGSFDPWSRKPVPDVTELPAEITTEIVGNGLSRLTRQHTLAAVAAVGVVMAGAATSFSWQGDSSDTTLAARPSVIQLFKERGARITAERTALLKSEELERLKREKDEASTAAQHLQDRLGFLQQAQLSAEKASRLVVAKSILERRVRLKDRHLAEKLRQELATERQAKQRADDTLQVLRAELEKEITAKAMAEKSGHDAQALLDQERLCGQRDARGQSAAGARSVERRTGRAEGSRETSIQHQAGPEIVDCPICGQGVWRTAAGVHSVDPSLV